ncbi:hypothetical protein PQQ81_01050 [Paraburkholderia strydomiana]|uniref:hypothetical protein n=1 Tax=Paraburkholderia strydomiana TaxID=1245417 RepID=UPI0038B9F212
MKSLPDVNALSRQAWLKELQQPQPIADDRASTRPAQSDFEKSIAWRGVFIAAFIVIAINLPFSPPPTQAHLTARSTV